jgi:hypothetical protein
MLSVGVLPVLPSSTSPLLPMILTHTLPLCSEINRRGCGLEPSGRCDTHRIIYCLGFPFYILERKSRDRAKDYSARMRIHATFLLRMLQI